MASTDQDYSVIAFSFYYCVGHLARPWFVDTDEELLVYLSDIHLAVR